MKTTGQFVIVTTTVPGKNEAGKLVAVLVRERIAACVQFMPIKSVYWWKGKVESASEYLLIAKTRKSLASALVARIKSMHSYEVPEIVVTPILGGFDKYLSWIAAETKALRQD